MIQSAWAITAWLCSITINGFARIDELVEKTKQMLDIGEMQPAGRFVQHVDSPFLRHVDGQLQPLALATRECRQRLTNAQVTKPDCGHPFQDGVGGRTLASPSAKKSSAFNDRHLEDLTDVLVTELVLEHCSLEPLALAHLAGGGDGVHEPNSV